MFSNAGKGDIERTSKWIHVFYKMKRNSPEFFSNRDVLSEGIQDSLKNQINLWLPVYDGCNILLHKIKNLEPKNYVFDEAIKTFIMMGGEFLISAIWWVYNGLNLHDRNLHFSRRAT